MTDAADALLARVRDAVADRYRVQRTIGRGGMATVFLADDIRHERPVAIKVLTPELGAIIGAERFLKEIKVTANLQHPHILGLLDSGQSDGLLWYAMPFVDGESLRQRLDRERQLPVAEALRIAREVADALHYAHRQGIIHRDIKPENVLLRDGRALVADFGIALAASRAGGERLTGTGLSLGTPSYMSPEQAQGDRDLDARTDQFSLAAMTYEMLAGQPPHVGPSVQAIMAGLLSRPPEPLDQLRPTVPESVVVAVHTALAKLPADRYATTADFAEALATGTGTGTAAVGTISGARRQVVRTRPWRVAVPLAAAALMVGLAVGWAARRPTPTVPRATFNVASESAAGMGSVPILSGDGTMLTFWGGNGLQPAPIFVRRLDDVQLRPVPGTERMKGEAFALAFDGRWIAYVTSAGLVRTALDGTGEMVLEPEANTGSWGGSAGLPDGSLIYGLTGTGTAPNGVFLVGPDGGPPRRITLDGDSANTVFDFGAVEDAGRVLCVRWIAGEAIIGVLEIASGSFTRIRPGVTPRMAGPDQMMFATRDGTLYVQRVDFRSGDTLQAARKIAEKVVIFFDAWASATAGMNGTVAFLQRGSGSASIVQRIDGGPATVLQEAAGFWAPRLSPDGTRIVFARYLSNANLGELWSYDLRTGTDQRLTATGAKGADFNDPVWSPDGTMLAVSAYDSADGWNQEKGKGIWLIRADGSAPPRLLLKREGDQWPSSFTPDGRSLLYVQRERLGDKRDIWSVPLAGGEPSPVVETAFNSQAARVSPDGQWLAFDSDETGAREVYVQRFPRAGDRIRVSLNGGRTPAFTRGGREILYWAGNELIAVEFAPGTGSPIGVRRAVAPVRFPSYTELAQFDLSADGKRLIMVEAPPTPNHFVVRTGVGVSSVTPR